MLLVNIIESLDSDTYKRPAHQQRYCKLSNKATKGSKTYSS